MLLVPVPWRAALRARVQDRRALGGAALPAVADRRQVRDAPGEERVGRLHVDDLGAPRVADRADVAHEEHAGLVNVEAGVVVLQTQHTPVQPMITITETITIT